MLIRKNLFRGTSLIEFVLVFPIFMLFLTGAIDYSILMYDHAIIKNASREGARYGIVYRTPTYASTTAVSDYTKTYCSKYLISFSSAPPVVSVTVTRSNANPKFGDTLQVTVSCTYTRLLYVTLFGLNQTATLSATTTMTYE